eukprot:6617393-Alexandrium_andersonii.AAC.1
MAAFVKTCEKKGYTWQKVWNVLVWSLRCMFDGYHPATNYDDQPWARGSYGDVHKNTPLTTEGWFCVVYRIA